MAPERKGFCGGASEIPPAGHGLSQRHESPLSNLGCRNCTVAVYTQIPQSHNLRRKVLNLHFLAIPAEGAHGGPEAAAAATERGAAVRRQLHARVPAVSQRRLILLHQVGRHGLANLQVGQGHGRRNGAALRLRQAHDQAVAILRRLDGQHDHVGLVHPAKAGHGEQRVSLRPVRPCRRQGRGRRPAEIARHAPGIALGEDGQRVAEEGLLQPDAYPRWNSESSKYYNNRRNASSMARCGP